MSHKYWNGYKETMEINDLKSLQNTKILNTIDKNYANAPVVRETWKRENIHPDEIEGISDFHKAPIFRKKDVKEYMDTEDFPYGGRLMLRESEIEHRNCFISTSSGTTGKSTNLIHSEHDQKVASEWASRHLWEAGLRPGDSYLNFAIARDVSLFTYSKAAHNIGASVININLSNDELDRVVHSVNHFKPTVVFTFTLPLVGAMNEYLQENDLDPKKIWNPVKSVIYTGGPLLDSYRREIENEWEVDVYELSGSLEPRWSCMECSEHGRWLHVPDDHFYVEAVGVDSGKVVEDNERGELVITPLSYETMAHLRWGHDDIVQIRTDVCECGRTGTRLKFLGRTGDLMKVQNKQILPWDVLKIVGDFKEMPNNYFQFYEESEDELQLRIGYDPSYVTDPSPLIDELENNLSSELGVQVFVKDAMSENELSKIGPRQKIPRIVND